MNRAKEHDNISGYKGVAENHGVSWGSRIYKNRKYHNLGFFPNKEEAAKAYNAAAIALFGEYAKLNEVE